MSQDSLNVKDNERKERDAVKRSANNSSFGGGH
jgi:hypothetical protein